MKSGSIVFTFRSGLLLIFLLCGLAIFFNGCARSDKNQSPSPNPVDLSHLKESAWDQYYSESQLISDTYRIDIDTIEVVFDLDFESGTATCGADVYFTMRTGQSRPLIHLTPAIQNPGILSLLRLNGETLTSTDENDVKVITHSFTRQKSLEFQRDMAAGVRHHLEAVYSLPLTGAIPQFLTDVNDPAGIGNEALFPTINAPHELAHHRITFRVRGDRAFRCIGSGLVQRSDREDIQEWTLDTEREIASYTVMFVLVPVEDTDYEERIIDGVTVRICAFKEGPDPAFGFAELHDWIPELNRQIGPFPMPEGLSILLTTKGGGMEYYGGTISSVFALRHEIFHMYFACSTINHTYRDTWLDEAITTWYEKGVWDGLAPIAADYRSNIVGGRSPVSLGFDMRAYSEGVQIMEAVAVELGGREQMVRFLSYLYQNYTFKPFTTKEFLDYLEAFGGIDMRERFDQWVYQKENSMAPAASISAGDAPYMMPVDTTPPPSILKKYRKQ